MSETGSTAHSGETLQGNQASITAEFLARHDRPGPRYTSYPTAIEFGELGRDQHEACLTAAADRSHEPLSLYVHLPFCASRCSFCACHVVIPGQVDLTEPYLRRLEAEAEMVAQRLGERRRVVQYHWGGGTPTHHAPKRLQALQRRILEHFSLDPEAEVAIEVDPRVTSVQHLETLRELGFSRLSLGVQDLDPDVQRLIGRHQTEHQTETLYRTARELGFPSINFDMIYGLPGQSLDTLRATLEKVVGMRPDRLAVYSFAYVPWMRPHQKRIDPETLPEAAVKFSLLAEVVATLQDAGYRHIGIDHFAVPNDDLVAAADAGTLTRTFMGYTTKRGTETVALGTSGISDIEGVYIQNHRRLASYFAAIDERRLPTERGYRLDREDLLRRRVISELMCNARVDLAAIGKVHRVDPKTHFAAELEALSAPEGLIEQGLASLDGLTLQATDQGRMFLRRLAMEFDTYLPRRDRPTFSRIV